MNERWVVYKTYYFYSVLSVCVLSLIAHTIALYAIKLSKRKTHQNIMLASLSTIELIASVHRTVYEVATLKEKGVMINHGKTLYKVLHYIHKIIVYVLIITMTVLTADRLVMAISPLKYKSRVTRQRVVVAIAMCWCIGVTSGVASAFHIEIDKYLTIFAYLIAAVYFILIPVTYCFIAFKIRQSRRNFGNAQEGRIKFRKEFLIPTILIATYIFLFVGPVMIINFFPWQMIANNSARFVAHAICQILPMIGTLADALTYVVLSSHYKKPLVNRTKEYYRNAVNFATSTSS